MPDCSACSGGSLDPFFSPRLVLVGLSRVARPLPQKAPHARLSAGPNLFCVAATLRRHFSGFLKPTLFVYAEDMLDEKDFQRKADAAFENLKKRLLTVGDEHGFDVEVEAGKLEVLFEEPEEVKFVISPNTPVREIWISALSTSFKLGWNDARNAFVLEKTGEDLYGVMARVISQQLGEEVKV